MARPAGVPGARSTDVGAASASLLRDTRRQLHARIATALEERFPATVVTQPELLAYHYTEAGVPEQTVIYWQRAGQRAMEHSVYVEAINHLAQGLKLLKTLPDIPLRTQQELALQMAPGRALAVHKGYGAPEVEQAYTCARELCKLVGKTPQPFPCCKVCGIFI